MKVVFVNPPDPPGGRYHQKDRASGLGTAAPLRPKRRPPPLPPLDLAHAAGIALAMGHQAEAIDLVAHPRQTVPAADWIGVRLSLYSLEEDLAFAGTLAAKGRVFLWGPVVRDTLPLWGPRPEWVLYGEIEALLPALLHGQQHPAILAPHQNGRVKWHKLTDLDQLALPAWHLFDLARYAPEGDVSRLVLHVRSSVGCDVACSMCPYFSIQGKWRGHSPARAYQELAYVAALGIRRVQFRDANISQLGQHVRELAQLLIDKPLGLQLIMETALENLAEADLRLLARAGLVHLITGIESVDREILESINQKADWLSPILHNHRLCQELGITLTTMYMVGFASDSWRTVLETVRFARSLRTDFSVSVMTPYHGTSYRRQALAEGLVEQPDAPFRLMSGFDAIVATRHLNAKEVQLAFEYAKTALDLAQRLRKNKSIGDWLRFIILFALSLPTKGRFFRHLWFDRPKRRPLEPTHVA